MEPLFFGPPDRRLFGVYHPADPLRPLHAGAVICGPIGPEYYRTYRVLSVLAESLASQGIDVLRFDYHGYGSSPGDSPEPAMPGRIADIGTALAELARGCAPERTFLLGLRSGADAALLALRDASRAGKTEKPADGADGLVLWAPEKKSRFRDLQRIHDALPARLLLIDCAPGIGRKPMPLPGPRGRGIAARASGCGPFWTGSTVNVPHDRLVETAAWIATTIDYGRACSASDAGESS